MRAIHAAALVLVAATLIGCRSRLHEDVQNVRASLVTVQSQCQAAYQSPALNPIRDKVEFLSNDAHAAIAYQKPADSPVPFAIASNGNHPTMQEREAIKQWATLRDQCHTEATAAETVPSSAPSDFAIFLQTEYSFGNEMEAKVGQLVVALYQGKLTYAEFAQKRYEISKATMDSFREFQHEAEAEHRQHQIEDEQLAQARFQRALAGFNAYLDAVNRRAPSVSTATCSTMGNTVTCMGTSR